MSGVRLTSVLLLPFLFCLLLGCLFEGEKKAGNATETGNVEGVVLSSNKDKVSGAKVSLFKKAASIDSPKETFVPLEETRTNEDGKFSFDVKEGDYTLIFSADEEYAFLDDIEAGTDKARDLEAVLGPPGILKGTIENTLELRGTGSIVVHLIGTDIFQNVDSKGDFEIEDIPAGAYTFVSYSTFQEEFSPLYKKVGIYQDSTTDLGKLQLPYSGIPIPKNINLFYDTTSATVNISWDPVPEFDDFQEYVILRGRAGQAKHDLEQIAYTKDTAYVDSISNDSLGTSYEYSVLVRNKLGDSGKYYGIYEISAESYQYFIPEIKNFEIAFDTADGLVSLEWSEIDSGQPFFNGYLVERHVYSNSDTIADTLAIMLMENFLIDTIHPGDKEADSLFFYYKISAVYKDWNLNGREISKVITISPDILKEAIPVVKNLKTRFDTLSGSVKLEWDKPDSSFKSFGGFFVRRRIFDFNNWESRERLSGGWDTLPVGSENALKDTIYPNIISWDSLKSYLVVYIIGVNHKDWEMAGRMVSDSVPVMSYRSMGPKIDAGRNQHVDISTMVKLEGKMLSKAFPVAKKEWKIGDGDWKSTEDLKVEFKTDSSFQTSVTKCVFRVVDSAGNESRDSLIVTKKHLTVSYNELPGKSRQGSITAFFKDKFWVIGEIDDGKMAIWSSEDMTNWKLENNNPLFSRPVTNKQGTPTWGGLTMENIIFKEKLWCFGYSNPWQEVVAKVWNSSDGIHWDSVKTNFPNYQATQTLLVGPVMTSNKVYWLVNANFGIGSKTLYITENGIDWNKKDLSLPDILAHRRIDLFTFQKQLCCNYEATRFCSENDGDTWVKAPLWDENYDLFPDLLYKINSNGSLSIATIYSKPEDLKKTVIYRNGRWEEIPGNTKTNGIYSGLFHQDKFLFVINNNKKLYSIKIR